MSEIQQISGKVGVAVVGMAWRGMTWRGGMEKILREGVCYTGMWRITRWDHKDGGLRAESKGR